MKVRRRFALLVSVVVAAGCAEMPVAPSADDLSPSLAAGGRPFTPGEQQTVTADGAWGLGPAGTGQNLAQTFTATSNQWLGYLELPVGCADGVLLNVQIRDGLGGAILYEANVAGLSGGVSTWKLIQVYDAATSRGIRLRKNQQYSIQLAAFPGPDATENTCGIARGPAGNSYSGGRAYYQDPINGPAFIPLPNGEPTDDEDLPFITLVR